jgi:hypothetical protein
MAYSPYDSNPDASPDVECSCGRIVVQTQFFECARCSSELEVRVTPKAFWMWVRPLGASPVVCPSCASRASLKPGLLHRTCECGRDELVQQGI